MSDAEMIQEIPNIRSILADIHCSVDDSLSILIHIHRPHSEEADDPNAMRASTPPSAVEEIVFDLYDLRDKLQRLNERVSSLGKHL